MVDENVEWEVPQVVDAVTPGNPKYSEAARLAKTVQMDGSTWGDAGTDATKLAHANNKMSCFACHSSWTTSCFGCHLSQKANKKKPNLHNEGGNSRNWISYNFQTLRDDIYFLAKDGTVSGNRVSPARSACAVIVSSQNQNREWVYSQQQTTSAGGFSGTAFSTYVPHTVRGTETRTCTDCHVARTGDNNAWMASLLMQGTGMMNFIGRYAYVGTEHGGFEAVAVTEREEPQAVIGSKLHELAFPAEFKAHQARGGNLKEAYHHGGDVRSLQLRGEYLFAAGRGRAAHLRRGAGRPQGLQRAHRERARLAPRPEAVREDETRDVGGPAHHHDGGRRATGRCRRTRSRRSTRCTTTPS